MISEDAIIKALESLPSGLRSRIFSEVRRKINESKAAEKPEDLIEQDVIQTILRELFWNLVYPLEMVEKMLEAKPISSIKALIPDAFGSAEKHENGEEFGKRFSSNIGIRSEERKRKKETQSQNRYLLLTALSIYTLHRIARDLLYSATKTGTDFKQTEYFKKMLSPIRSFDWEAKTSPLSALGGMNGVNKAYDLLSEVIGQEKYVSNVEKPLGNF